MNVEVRVGRRHVRAFRLDGGLALPVSAPRRAVTACREEGGERVPLQLHRRGVPDGQQVVRRVANFVDPVPGRCPAFPHALASGIPRRVRGRLGVPQQRRQRLRLVHDEKRPRLAASNEIHIRYGEVAAHVEVVPLRQRVVMLDVEAKTRRLLAARFLPLHAHSNAERQHFAVLVPGAQADEHLVMLVRGDVSRRRSQRNVLVIGKRGGFPAHLEEPLITAHAALAAVFQRKASEDVVNCVRRHFREIRVAVIDGHL